MRRSPAGALPQRARAGVAALLLAVVPLADAQPTYDLASYLRIADAYASAGRESAVREIRAWPGPAIRMAVSDVQGRRDRLRAFADAPDTIALGTVEAAVLMHAEAGLLALRASSSTEEAGEQLRAATALFSWSRQAASDLRPRMDLRPRIERGPLSLALAAGALAAGQPTTARPFAADARQAAPLDPDAHFVFGCVAEGLAELRSSPGRESTAAALRDEAAKAYAEALVLDAGVFPEAGVAAQPTGRAREARLRLGRVALEQGWLPEARKGLEGVLSSGDERQRYLARLLLGRLAEREGRLDEAIASYRRALAVWPESQSAALALAHASERASGPLAARPLVANALALPMHPGSPADPWRSYLFGPPGLAAVLFDRVRTRALGL